MKKKAGLSFLTRDTALALTESGRRAIVPGRPEQSELLRRVATDNPEERMPPGADPLASGEIDALRRWIAAGALWPEHWAYRPIQHPALPPVRATEWVRNPIDQFILAQLERRNIRPSPEADRYTLIRRLCLDLTGLPPTPSEADDFVKEPSPDAYDRLVDRLLQSPHFGERWGRHWLDQARYADSDGYEKDNARPDAWRWRAWVIRAINDDLPFDQFTIQQLAGDLIPGATAAQRLATAFHVQTLFNREGGVDPEEDRTKRVIDRVNTTATVWLGLTAGCAQCHDHPYDALRQEEYYGLYAFFNNADETELAVPAHPATTANPQTDPADSVMARALAERSENPRETYVFHRGDFLQPLRERGVVKPGTPALLPALASRGPDADRLDLARWLVDPANPLTARVRANKIWAHLFGTGLVATMDDLGPRGQAPTLPELLDWLASQYQRNGWSRKQLIRLIVCSATYRQSSRHRPELSEIDPDNRWLHRQNRLRVEAEIVRDLHLAVSGLLQHQVGGPSVYPPVPDDVAALSYAGNFKWKTSTGADRYRRGMYTFFKRTAPDPNLMVFDCPDANVTRTARSRSNTPLQALATLQNEVYVEAAQALARRVLSVESASDRERMSCAFRLCLARPPSEAELGLLLELLGTSRAWCATEPEAAQMLSGKAQSEEGPAAEAAAWVATVRMILNLDEFIVRE